MFRGTRYEECFRLPLLLTGEIMCRSAHSSLMTGSFGDTAEYRLWRRSLTRTISSEVSLRDLLNRGLSWNRHGRSPGHLYASLYLTVPWL